MSRPRVTHETRKVNADESPSPRAIPQQAMIGHRLTSGRLARLAGVAVRFRWFGLAIGLAIMLAAFPASRRLEIDRSVIGMFDVDDPAIGDFKQLRDDFGGNAVAMLVYADRGFASVEGFARNREISARAAAIEGVRPEGILSPAVLSDAVQAVSPQGLFGGGDSTPPLLRPNDPVAQGFDDLFAGYTHSADHRRAAVVVMLEPDHPPQTIIDLQRLAANLPSEFGPQVSDVALVGEPVLVHDGFALIERDGTRLAVTTIVLLSVVLLLTLRDVRQVVLMGLVIGWSILVTRAVMVAAAVSLSLVSTILAAIVTVITVAAVLHLGVRYAKSRKHGVSPRMAGVTSLAILSAPIFWTCATDAAGFAALYGSRIAPVRQFGMMIAVASLSVFVALMLFAPSLMTIRLPAFRIATVGGNGRLSRRVRATCQRVALACMTRRYAVVAATTLLVTLALLGVSQTRTETSFLRNFRADSAVVRAYDDVERNFGGAGVWDVLLDAPDQLSTPYLKSVRQLEDQLREIDVDGERLTKVLSLADADAIAARSQWLRMATPTVRLAGMRLKIPVFFNALLSDQPGDRRLRIMLRSHEHLGAEEKMKMIRSVESVVAKHTASTAWKELTSASAATPGKGSGKVTGYYVIMARLVANLVEDQWRCFLASAVMVWLLLAGATRSLRLASAALLPNLLPVLFVLAAVGFLGGKLNMGAAMIAAVSVGLTIDGSVHFLAGYQRSRRRGRAVARSVTRAAGDVAMPVLLATVALVIGFSVLAGSEFVPTATFGALIAATLTAGTLINLTLLPAFIACLDR